MSSKKNLINLKDSSCRVLFASKQSKSPSTIELDQTAKKTQQDGDASPSRKQSNNLESVATRIARSPLNAKITLNRKTMKVQVKKKGSTCLNQHHVTKKRSLKTKSSFATQECAPLVDDNFTKRALESIKAE